MSAPGLKLVQEPGIAYSLLDAANRRALAFELVWGEMRSVTRTDIERRLVGCFEQIAKDIEQHDPRQK